MELKQERLVDPNLYNPPLAFQELAFANKRFFVVRDDLLPSGTKGRAMVDFMKRSPATDFIYAGPSTGYAQIVVAYAAALCGKRAHVFVEKNEPRNNLTAAAMCALSLGLILSMRSSFHAAP